MRAASLKSSMPVRSLWSSIPVIGTLALLLGAGPSCTSHNPGYTAPDGGDRDGGGGHDGSGGQDGSTAGRDLATPPQGDAALSCQDIKNEVENLLAASKSCQVDADCVHAKTACGLPGACGDDGTIVNTGWLSPAMATALGEWVAESCATNCLCPPIVGPTPACVNGMCTTGTNAPGPVGAPCTADTQCATGECLTEGEDGSYPGGYCTVKECDKVAAGCPAGSSCRGVSQHVAICLADCSADDPCRSGYSCCKGPIAGPNTGWCSPPKSPLCLEL